MNFRNRPVYMDDRPGDTGGGGAGVVAPTIEAKPAEVVKPDPAGSSILAKGAEAKPDISEIFAEKFRVMNAAGKLDIEASARKQAESHSHLEKRMGGGDAPPKTAEEYSINVPEAFKEAFPDDSPKMAEFRKDAHAQGLNQKQFDFFINKYVDEASGLVQGAAQHTMDEATEDLKGTWKTDAEFKTGTSNAFKAWAAYADPADAGKMDEVGNQPAIVRLLARIGAELGESRGIPPDGQSSGTSDVKELMRSPAYSDAKHPDHSKVSAKVKAHYEKTVGTAPIER